MRERLLTVVEAAEVLKVKKNTVYDMIKRGDLKASKLGKQLRIRQEDLDEYIRYGGRMPKEAAGEEGSSSAGAGWLRSGLAEGRRNDNGPLITVSYTHLTLPTTSRV